MAGKDGKFVLGTSNKAKLIIWDKLHTKEINIFPSGWQGNNDCFYKILCFGKDVIVIPKFSNMILKVNLETEEVCEEKLTLTKLVDLNTLFSINFGQYSMVESLNEEKIFLQDAFSDNIEKNEGI